MYRIFLFACFFASLLWSIKTQAQTFTPSFANGQVTIHEGYTPTGIADTTAIEYVLIGDCEQHWTGKLKLRSILTFPCPSGFESGFLVQRHIWHGERFSNGQIAWTRQSGNGTCYRRPTGSFSPEQVDTVELTPFVLEVPTSANVVDWHTVSTTGDGRFEVSENANAPDGVTKSIIVVSNLAGYVMDAEQPLPQGIYYVVMIWEWQHNIFYEQDELIIF